MPKLPTLCICEKLDCAYVPVCFTKPMRRVVGLPIIDKKDTYKTEVHWDTAISVNELARAVAAFKVLQEAYLIH